MTFALTPERHQRLQALLDRYPTKRSVCIPLLHLCQEQVGWIKPEVIDYVAQTLEMSTAAVQGVVTFYTSLFQAPLAPHVVWVCRTLSCELRGAAALQKHLEKRFACAVGGSSSDGKFTLRKAECLAACGGAPVVQINQRYVENLNLAKLDAVIDELSRASAEDTTEDLRLPTLTQGTV